MQKSDFTHRRHFPGTHGNPFDVVLRVCDVIESLPTFVFAALIFGLALLPTRANWLWALGLWLFFLSDWALLAALPRARKSFGPAKPPTLMLACLRLLPALLPLPFAFSAQLIGTLLVVYSFWIEPHRLTLTRQTLQSKKLSPGPPLRLLHLGDLHLERRTEREQQLLTLVQSTAPDLILFSGDFLNLSNLRDPEAHAEVRALLQELTAPLGVFVVSGSPAVDLPELVPELLQDLPLRWLQNERVRLEHHGQVIDLVGVTCTHKPFVDGPQLVSLLTPPLPSKTDDGEFTPSQPPPSPKPGEGGGENFTILLYHTPDLAPEAAEAGIDLQLSGHTHGGQVRLPFYGALFAGSLYGKQFEVGRRQVGEMTLYVTRGIGMEGKGAPRVRFLCPPEITLWEISGEGQESKDLRVGGL